MPKELRALPSHRQSPYPVAQTRQLTSVEPQPVHKNSANWSSADDEVLLAARAAGLNWQSTASKHFPSKTANACRKRHERLIERRTHEDWDIRRLDTLALEYMEIRREIWGPLAAKVGERWAVVEAKCMEKGLKNLQSIARAARKTCASNENLPAQGNKEEDEGDSGIGCSDAEMEPADSTASAHPSVGPATFRGTQPEPGLTANQQHALFHVLPRPPPLPLYQPPPSAPVRTVAGTRRVHPAELSGSSPSERERTPDNSTQRSVSIKSMLSHTPLS